MGGQTSMTIGVIRILMKYAQLDGANVMVWLYKHQKVIMSSHDIIFVLKVLIGFHVFW